MKKRGPKAEKRKTKSQMQTSKDLSLFSFFSFRFSFFAFLLSGLVVSGCSKYYYNPAPQILPQYITKMAVRPFANHTRQYGIEDKLTLAVQQIFNQDGRYQITSEEQADGVVIGDITKYILEPLAFDSNHVTTQYKLWILVNVSFYDKIKNQTLWLEPNMGNPIIFYSASSNQPAGITESEAQQRIWNQLAVDISTRTFEGFGTVTGNSDKAVPKSTPEQHNRDGGAPDPSPAVAPNQAPSTYR